MIADDLTDPHLLGFFNRYAPPLAELVRELAGRDYTRLFRATTHMTDLPISGVPRALVAGDTLWIKCVTSKREIHLDFFDGEAQTREKRCCPAASSVDAADACLRIIAGSVNGHG